MAGMDWFRWHHGSVTDPKFQLVARRAGASLPDVLAVWTYILEQASQASERGTFGQIDAEALDVLFGFPDTETRTSAILAALESRELIKDGRICAWDKRQPKREREDNTSADRQRTYRAKQSQVTPSNASVTPDNTKKRLEESRGDKSREEEGAPASPDLSTPRRRKKTQLPDSFGVSDRVKAWAAESGFGQLEQHLAAFKRKAIAKGYAYVSWDDAFMEAIREDWAKLRGGSRAGVAPPGDPSLDPDSRAAIEAEGKAKGIGPWDETREQWHSYKARVRPPEAQMTLGRLQQLNPVKEAA